MTHDARHAGALESFASRTRVRRRRSRAARRIAALVGGAQVTRPALPAAHDGASRSHALPGPVTTG